MKSYLTAVGLCITMVLSLGSPAHAAEPQENPETTPIVYDGVALLQKYSQVLDDVSTGNASDVQELQAESVFANLPPELGTAVGGFFSAGISLTSLLPSLQKDLADAKIFLEQYRVDDAKQTLNDARQVLTQSYSHLLTMSLSAFDTASWWKVDAAPAGSTLQQANDEVQERLSRVRSLLEFYANILQVESQQTTLPSLPSTTLSFTVQPTTGYVGENMTFYGILTSGNSPLTGRNITILLDHSPVIMVTTSAVGAFQGTVALPFRYSSNVTVQAIFVPQGNDVNRYLGCSSPEVIINVLFYQAVLNVTQGTPASPGRDFLVQGAFNYGNNPALPERLLNVYLDNNLIFDGDVGVGFFLRLPVVANTSLGTHRFMFAAPASGRYAPTQTNLDIVVSQIAPIVEVKVPGVILLPFSPQIEGNVRSATGPLTSTTVEITLGNWKTSARTGADGSFSGRLDTGLSLTFLGAQDLRVTVNPTEPWYRSGSRTVRVMVINPVNIAGIFIILLVLTASGLRRLQRKVSLSARLGEQAAPGLVPVLIKPEIIPSTAARASGDPRSLLLSLYQGVLRFVLRITGMMLPPHETLREFTTKHEQALGPAGKYFREFTLIIERLLYSRHDFDERDVAHARELSGKLLKGAGNEDS